MDIAERHDSQPSSMKRRMQANDYTARNIYMITIATEGRQRLLGTLEGSLDAPAGSEGAPWVRLTALGQRVAQEVEGISAYYPQVRVLAKQVMPDHLHFIVFVTEQLPVPLGRVINGFKAGCRRALREVMAASQSDAPRDTTNRGRPQATTTAGTPQAAAPAGRPGVALPSAGVACAAAWQQPVASPHVPRSAVPGVLWEKGYNDRVLYGKGQLDAMIAYIHDNPRRLLAKRCHQEFFRHDTVVIGGSTLHAFGNMRLLADTWRVAVRCSRSLNDEEQQQACQDYLRQADEGAVLVSPFISPGERMVLRAAIECCHRLIVIADNGFPPYYKPGGRLFDACAAGRLLLLSPFGYHTQQVDLSRSVCNQMNAIATTLATTGHHRR